MNIAKKQKTYHFKKDWEEEFFFMMNKDNYLYLIRNMTIDLSKRGNLNRHFNTMHAHYNLDYPPNSIMRKTK